MLEKTDWRGAELVQLCVGERSRVVLGSAFVDFHEARRLRHGELTQSDRVEQREDGGVRADRNAERENDDESEQAILRELPEGETKVTREIVEKRHQGITIYPLNPIHVDRKQAQTLSTQSSLRDSLSLYLALPAFRFALQYVRV